MRVDGIELGSKIRYSERNIIAYVVGKQQGYVCIGLKDFIFGSQGFYPWKINGRGRGAHYEYVDDIEDYKYAYWIPSTFNVELLEMYIKKIENADQICVECKSPAPHIKSNLPDNMFICNVCVVIKELC